MQGTCFDENAYRNKDKLKKEKNNYSKTAEEEEADEYEQDDDADEEWDNFDQSTGLNLASLKDGTFFTKVSTAGTTTTVQTGKGAVQQGVSDSAGLGGLGGPDAARKNFGKASKKQSKRNLGKKYSKKNAGSMEDGSKGKMGDDDYDEMAESLLLEGHESYNLNTLASYQSQFGLETQHMARMNPNDMIMQVTNLMKPNDPAKVTQLLKDCAPYKLRTKVKKIKTVKKLKADAEKDPLTGKYHHFDYDMVEEEVEEDLWVVPAHSIFLSRNMPRFLGGAAACNDRVGCECLSEPTDLGEQPKYHAALC
jgi:hypothetical protein